MEKPPFFLEPFLHDVESVVVKMYRELPTLRDKDIENVFEKLESYYKSVSMGKSVEEPELRSDKQQDLIDEILNKIDDREERNLDTYIIDNPNVKVGDAMISSLAFLYQKGFKRLVKSVRRWRKKDGKTGYLNYVSEFF